MDANVLYLQVNLDLMQACQVMDGKIAQERAEQDRTLEQYRDELNHKIHMQCVEMDKILREDRENMAPVLNQQRADMDRALTGGWGAGSSSRPSVATETDRAVRWERKKGIFFTGWA
jgi:GTP-binding protein EngB required for normal cell division